MAIALPPELEQRVTRLAEDSHREPQQVLAELVSAALDEDAAFRAEVRAGLAELDAGQGIPHEDAMDRVRALLGRHGSTLHPRR